MLLLIAFNNVMYGIDCEIVICYVDCGKNKPKTGLFFTNV